MTRDPSTKAADFIRGFANYGPQIPGTGIHSCGMSRSDSFELISALSKSLDLPRDYIVSCLSFEFDLKNGTIDPPATPASKDLS